MKEGKGQSGTGGGATVEPIAFVVIDADGKASLLSLQDKEVSWGQIVQLMPDALGKIKSFVDGRGKKDDEDEEHETPERTQ